jgi:hypothetical protein
MKRSTLTRYWIALFLEHFRSSDVASSIPLHPRVYVLPSLLPR